MSYTARLNPNQTVEENRTQHVNEFAQYIAGEDVDLERLRFMHRTLLNGLSSWSDREDWKTQNAKLSAIVEVAAARFPLDSLGLS